MLDRLRQFHVILALDAAEARRAAVQGRFAQLGERLAQGGDDVHVWHLAGATRPLEERHGTLTTHRSGQWRCSNGSSTADPTSIAFANPAPLASYLLREVLLPHIRATGGSAVMLAEDAATVGAMLHLDWVLRWAGLRDRAVMMWNASHPFGLERIDWRAISRATYVTTTSASVRCRLWGLGVHPVVIPDQLPPDALQFLPDMTDREIRNQFDAWR